MFLTENYAALEILRHYLNDVVHSSPLDSVATDSEDGGERSLEKMEPFILFGSSFPRDKEYTQVCVCGGVALAACMCNVMVGHSNWIVDGTTAEVEITCGHQSNSARFITMTDHKCEWLVGMTNRS